MCIRDRQYYDKDSREVSFEIGDKVLLHDPTTKVGECAKLKGGIGPQYVVHQPGQTAQMVQAVGQDCRWPDGNIFF